MRRKEMFYYAISREKTVYYIANQIHGFTIDYGEFILKADKPRGMLVEHEKNS